MMQGIGHFDEILAAGRDLLKHLEWSHGELRREASESQRPRRDILVELSAFEVGLVADVVSALEEQLDADDGDLVQVAQLVCVVPEVVRLLSERPDIRLLGEPLARLAQAAGVTEDEFAAALQSRASLYDALDIARVPVVNKLLLRVKRLRSMYVNAWRWEVWGRVDWLAVTEAIPRARAMHVRERALPAVAVIQAYSAWVQVAWWVTTSWRTRILALGAAGVAVAELFLTDGGLLGRMGAVSIGLAVYAAVLGPMRYITGLGAGTLRAGERRHQFALAGAAAVVLTLALADVSPTQPLALALYGTAAVHGVLAASFVAAEALGAFVWRWKHRRYPGEEVINTLCWDLRYIEEQERSLLVPPSLEHTAPWPSREFRRELAVQLGYLANTIEHAVPRVLGGCDHHTDSWVRERAAMQAAAVRRLTRASLTGAAQARHNIELYLGRTLDRLGDERWVSLDTAPAVPAPRGWSIVRAAGSLTRAALPLAAVALLGTFVESPILDGLVPLSAGWLMTSAFTALDGSSAIDKLNTASELGTRLKKAGP